MRECVGRIAEAIRAKIMVEDVKPEPAESPCQECRAQGCCEMVKCSVKSKQNQSLDVLHTQVLRHGVPAKIMIDYGERNLQDLTSNCLRDFSNKLLLHNFI